MAARQPTHPAANQSPSAVALQNGDEAQNGWRGKRN